jgi:hypothetical protein
MVRKAHRSVETYVTEMILHFKSMSRASQISLFIDWFYDMYSVLVTQKRKCFNTKMNFVSRVFDRKKKLTQRTFATFNIRMLRTSDVEIRKSTYKVYIKLDF